MRLVGLTFLVLSPVIASAFGQEGDVDRGRTLAEGRCAGCHAVGQSDQSKVPAAPPFRGLDNRYPLESLEEAFAEGVATAHPDAPQLRLSPEEIVDLLSYIAALSEG